MTYLHYFGLYLVLHLPALALCYVLWIKHERGGWRRVCHFFGAVGFFPDVVANYTTLAIIFWRWPGRSYTFSKHLGVLVTDAGLRGKLARPIAGWLDRRAPSGKHINATV